MFRGFSKSSLLLAAVALAAAGFFFADRVACLLWKEPKSTITGWDSCFYFYWLRSPVIGGDFDFRDDVRECAWFASGRGDDALAQPPTPNGHLPNKYGVGWAVSTAPFYLAADAWVRAGLTLGATGLRRDGSGPPYQWAVQLGQFFYAALGLGFAYALLRRWHDPDTALQALLIVWLGSFLFYYQTSLLSMSHNITFCALAACYGCTLRASEDPGRTRFWAGLGFCGGLAIISRYQSAIYLLYPAVVSLSLLRRAPQHWPRVLAGASAGAAVIALQLGAWQIVYGSWLVDSYSGEGFDWGNPQVRSVLFSPFHGLFYWSPLLLPAAVAFAFAPVLRAGSRWTWAVVFLLCIYVNAAWSCWWFGSSFGARAFEGCVLFCMFGLAEILRRVRSRRWLAPLTATAAALLIAFNLALAYGARKNRIPLEEPVTYAEMVKGLLR